MAKRKSNTGKSDATSANVGYEAQLWQMADAPARILGVIEAEPACPA